MTANQTVTFSLRTSDNKFYAPTLPLSTTIGELTEQLVEDKIITPGNAPVMITNEDNSMCSTDPGLKLSELGIEADSNCSICIMPSLG